jgi:hypothetical protein
MQKDQREEALILGIACCTAALAIMFGLLLKYML